MFILNDICSPTYHYDYMLIVCHKFLLILTLSYSSLPLKFYIFLETPSFYHEFQRKGDHGIPIKHHTSKSFAVSLIRSITSTPKGHNFIQAPQAMQSSALADIPEYSC